MKASERTVKGPGGVGEDRSLPVVLFLQRQPNTGMTLSGFFAGAELGGRLQLERAAGHWSAANPMTRPGVWA